METYTIQASMLFELHCKRRVFFFFLYHAFSTSFYSPGDFPEAVKQFERSISHGKLCFLHTHLCDVKSLAFPCGGQELE
jgi:hypothetical protein